ncbi:MAG: hypothetical protein PW734_01260 [Verrucomicrobium sp.]|nr:hypothetical protein [Verrucomicrobium sp.]
MMPDSSKPVDWYLLAGLIFILVAGACTIAGDKACFLQEPTNDLQRLIGVPTLIAYEVTHQRAGAALGAFIFWGVTYGLIVFICLRLIINKVLLPSQLRSMVKAERLQTYLKNKYRDEIPESDHHL